MENVTRNAKWLQLKILPIVFLEEAEFDVIWP